MKRKVCGGTGRRMEESDNGIGWIPVYCEYCNGTGKVEQTNEEWFDTLTTKGKAEVIAQLSSYGGNVEAILDWLKEKHNG